MPLKMHKKINNMKYAHTLLFVIFFAFTFCTMSLYAQEIKTITVVGETVSYTSKHEDVANAYSYYNGDQLVLTEYDENTDGTIDVWIFYRDDYSVRKEMRDSDNDGTPDMFFTFNNKEELIKESGKGIEKYKKVIKRQPVTTEMNNEIDYAGNLENIQELAGEAGTPWMWYLLGLLVLIGGVLWLRKKNV